MTLDEACDQLNPLLDQIADPEVREALRKRAREQIAAAMRAASDGAATMILSRNNPQKAFSPGLAHAASRLIESLSAIAAGGGVAAELVVDRAERAVRALYPDRRAKPKLWQWVLEARFQLQGATDVESILRDVTSTAPDAPASFRAPTERAVARARRLLAEGWTIDDAGSATTKLTLGEPDAAGMQRHTGGDGHITAWQLARRFAACFDEPMPAKREVLPGRRKAR